MGGDDSKIEETEQQKASAEVAMSQWKDYLEKYRPFEDSYMEDVDRMNTNQQYNQVAGLAAVPVESQFSTAVRDTSRAMVSGGLNPTSGAFKSNLSKLDRAKSTTKADNMNQAQVGQQNRYVSGISNIVRMGQGQETEAVQGYGDLATNSARKASNDAGIALNNRRDNQQLAGAVVGAGTRYGLNYIDNNGGA
ncbi:MAG: hypothetical protein CMP19_10395 [Rickettsiales bacterium]|nr:hypothetical protein [Rickettsiales bacterium]